MFLQLVEEKYKNWKEHHAPTEVKFKSRELTAGGRGSQQKYRRCDPSVSLEVTPPEENESKDCDIYCMTSLEVNEFFPPVFFLCIDIILKLCLLLQINQESVDRGDKNIGKADIPTCELAIDWKGQQTTDLPVLKRRINLLGAETPKSFTLRICPAIATGQ